MECSGKNQIDILNVVHSNKESQKFKKTQHNIFYNFFHKFDICGFIFMDNQYDKCWAQHRLSKSALWESKKVFLVNNKNMGLCLYILSKKCVPGKSALKIYKFDAV